MTAQPDIDVREFDLRRQLSILRSRAHDELKGWKVRDSHFLDWLGEHMGPENIAYLRFLMKNANALTDEAATALETLEARVKVLETALEKLDIALTCRRDDDAHYCPNCDNSLYDARETVRAALLKQLSGHGE